MDEATLELLEMATLPDLSAAVSQTSRQHPRDALRLALRAQTRPDRMLANQSSGVKCG